MYASRRHARILTDLSISQVQKWQQRTELFELFNSGKNRHHVSCWPFVSKSAEPRFLRGYEYLVEYFISFHAAWKMFQSRHHHDILVTSDVRFGLQLALLQSFLGWKSKAKHVLLEFWLNESPGLLGKVRTMVRRFAARSIHTVVCSSSAECVRYAVELRIPPARIRFVPFHVNGDALYLKTTEQNYILSAGSSGRDYAALLAAAKMLPVRLVIVAGRRSLAGLEIPSNVDTHYDIERAEYLGLLANCRAAVVPLENRLRSSGQVAFLEAMGCGKPVIVTRTPGTVDYIVHGVTGILVEPDDPEALAAAIADVLSDPQRAQQMGQLARQFVITNYRLDHYVEKILGIVEEAAENGSVL